jgi:hypothetical protein
MNKISIFSMLILLGLTVTFNACKKDDFTEKDAINLINNQDVNDAMKADSLANAVYFSVKVVNASTDYFNKSAKALTGVTVTVSSNGQLATATTGADGIAYFNNLRIGSYAITVAATGFTTVDFTAATADKGYYSVQVPILSLTANLMTVTGTVTFDSNVTTAARETVSGQTVLFTPDFTNFSIAGKQGVTSISYSGFPNTAVTSATGVYTLTVPADAQGDLKYKLSIPDFETDETILMSTINGVDVTGAGNIAKVLKARFGTSATVANTTPTVSPIYCVFSDPTAITAATFTTTLYNQNGVESVNVTSAGSGYAGTGDPTGLIIKVSDGTNNAYITPAIDAATGRILYFTVNSKGQNFSGAPSINLQAIRQIVDIKVGTVSGGAITSMTVTNGGLFLTKNVSLSVGGGSGAILTPNWTVAYDNNGEERGWKISSVTVNNGGTGYGVGNTASANVNGFTAGSASANMTTGKVQNVTVNTVGANYPKSSSFPVAFSTGNAAATAYSDANGLIYAVEVTDGGNGYTVAPSVSLPTANTTAKGTVTVNSTSGLVTGVTITKQGGGYTSPTVTFYNQITGIQITDLLYNITLTGDKITGVTINNPGAGIYFGNIAARTGDGSATVNSVPNGTVLKNFDLGTGYRTINQ